MMAGTGTKSYLALSKSLRDTVYIISSGHAFTTGDCAPIPILYSSAMQLMEHLRFPCGGPLAIRPPPSIPPFSSTH